RVHAGSREHLRPQPGQDERVGAAPGAVPGPGPDRQRTPGHRRQRRGRGACSSGPRAEPEESIMTRTPKPYIPGPVGAGILAALSETDDGLTLTALTAAMGRPPEQRTA